MVETALFSIYRRSGPAPAAPAGPEPPPPGDSVLPALGIVPPGMQPAAAPGAAASQPEPPAPITHQLLGLASPVAVTVRASVVESGAAALATGHTGISSAPWNDATAGSAGAGLAAGTRLLTARGEIPVEDLAPGDAVLALRGPALLPIRTIGHTRTGTPLIRIEAGALGPDRPRRALCVSADQPVYLDHTPVPTPARALVNGVTIRTAALPGAELFHIDVGAPEVLFADGLPVASVPAQS